MKRIGMNDITDILRHRHGELPEKTQGAVDSWLGYDDRAEALRGAIRDWPAQAEALLADVPPPDAPLDAVTKWRERAETLLGESAAMRAEDAPHAPHLEALPEEAKAVADTTPRLDAAAVEVEYREMGLLMGSAREFVERTGGILYDAPVHGALMERAASLGARDGLPERVSERVETVVDLDARCAKDRERVGAFIDAARGVEHARGNLDAAAGARQTSAEQLPGWDGWEKKARAVADEAGAIRAEVPPRQLNAHLASLGFGTDEIDERKKKIEERIERDRQAREAAEAARRAAEEARVAEETRRMLDGLRASVEAVDDRADLSREIRECLEQREAGAREHGGLFVFRDPHREWMSGAEALLAKANRHLEEAGKRHPDPERDEGTKTLRGLTADLDRTLREDRATIERIEKERAREQTRQQDRSQGRGFSM